MATLRKIIEKLESLDPNKSGPVVFGIYEYEGLDSFVNCVVQSVRKLVKDPAKNTLLPDQEVPLLDEWDGATTSRWHGIEQYYAAYRVDGVFCFVMETRNQEPHTIARCEV